MKNLTKINRNKNNYSEEWKRAYFNNDLGFPS